MTPTTESAAESIGLILAEHHAACGLCAGGEPCDEADDLIVRMIEVEPVSPRLRVVSEPAFDEVEECGGEA